MSVMGMIKFPCGLNGTDWAYRCHKKPSPCTGEGVLVLITT